MSRPVTHLAALAVAALVLAAPSAGAGTASSLAFEHLHATADATDTSRSVAWPVDLAMGETLQVTTCAEVLAPARNAGDTVIRLATAGGAPLDHADDGCGEGGRGSSLVFTAGADMRVVAWLGCRGDATCSGVAALRTDRNSNGNAADLPAAVGGLAPIRHARVYTHAAGIDHPDGYAAPGVPAPVHARLITRLPRDLGGEDFLLAYTGGDGAVFRLRHDWQAPAVDEPVYRTGSPLVAAGNASRARRGGLGGGHRLGGGQRFGRYLVTAVTDAGGAGYRNEFHELSGADATGGVLRVLPGGAGSALYAAITRLQGADASADAMFPAGHARSFLLANLRESGEGLAIDFRMLPGDRHGWFDVAAFDAPAAPWYTWRGADLLPAGRDMQPAGNADLFTGRDGRVWLVHYVTSAAFGLGNPWFETQQDTVRVFRVLFAGQPFDAAGGVCAQPVCIERNPVEPGTISGGEGDGGLSPDASFLGAASGYLAPPAGEALFVYSSEYGDNGTDRLRVYEWTPARSR